MSFTEAFTRKIAIFELKNRVFFCCKFLIKTLDPVPGLDPELLPDTL
jgi:hypothetical protein